MHFMGAMWDLKKEQLKFWIKKNINNLTYVLNCSAKIRLVDVPVIVVSPPMVAE